MPAVFQVFFKDKKRIDTMVKRIELRELINGLMDVKCGVLRLVETKGSIV